MAEKFNGSIFEADLALQKIPTLQLVPASGRGGFSKIGGHPTAPGNLEWPWSKDSALSFLAQVSLSEAAGSDYIDNLPGSGLLWFFYDPEQFTWGYDPDDRGSWQVLYTEEPAPTLITHEPPEDLPEEGVYGECFVQFQRTFTHPASELQAIDEKFDVANHDWEQINRIFYAGLKGSEWHHQVGGAPDVVQNDTMQLECQLVSNGINCGDASGYEDSRVGELAAGASDWQLLLQLDSDDDLGMMWGDCGFLYFWIRKQDLAARDFSKVWMILQCS